MLTLKEAAKAGLNKVRGKNSGTRNQMLKIIENYEDMKNVMDASLDILANDRKSFTFTRRTETQLRINVLEVIAKERQVVK